MIRSISFSLFCAKPNENALGNFVEIGQRRNTGKCITDESFDEGAM